MNIWNVLCCEKKASQAWQNHKQECSLVCGFVATGSSRVLIFAVISRNTISIPESVHVFASLTVIILIFWWLYSLVIAVVVFQGSMIALGDFSAYNNTQVNQKHLIKCTFVAKCNRLYDMATVVCMLVLQTAKRALLTYNDVAFQATCRCPWHIQYLYGQCYGQIDSCQKGYPLTIVTWLYPGLKCTTLSLGQCIKASVWDFPVMTLLSLNKWCITYVMLPCHHFFPGKQNEEKSGLWSNSA